MFLFRPIVLTSYGNAYVRTDRPAGLLRLLDSHAAFDTDRTLQFGRARSATPVEAVGRWFRSLRRRQVQRLCCTVLTGIVVEDSHGVQAWQAEPELGGPTRHTHYRARTIPRMPRRVTVSVAGRNLNQTVQDAIALARENGRDEWATWFDEAYRTPGGEIARYLPPVGYTRAAARLMLQAAALDTACTAWERDAPLADPVMNRLRATVDVGLLAAVNSFAWRGQKL